MLDRCEVVFCVLAYKNSVDLRDLVNSIYKQCRFKFRIIIINSYYNDETLQDMRMIAEEYKCDFLNVPNKGYGAGNNSGIEYAVAAYDFAFLVVCNPDTVIRKLELRDIFAYKNEKSIIAPKIVSAVGKNQNPAIFQYNKRATRLIYTGYKKDKKITLYRGFAINKVNRLLFLAKKDKSGKKIFQAHGSFVIFTKPALEKLMPIYDENIFLFCEEMDLAFKAKANGVETIYVPEIDIYHKEDGSMKLSDLNIYNESKKSCIYCSEKWGIAK